MTVVQWPRTICSNGTSLRICRTLSEQNEQCFTLGSALSSKILVQHIPFRACANKQPMQSAKQATSPPAITITMVNNHYQPLLTIVNQSLSTSNFNGKPILPLLLSTIDSHCNYQSLITIIINHSKPILSQQQCLPASPVGERLHLQRHLHWLPAPWLSSSSRNKNVMWQWFMWLARVNIPGRAPERMSGLLRWGMEPLPYQMDINEQPMPLAAAIHKDRKVQKVNRKQTECHQPLID